MNLDLEKLTVRKDASIRSAMQAIDRGSAEIALVVDEDGRLQGTLTDGDVRRALLTGADLSAPIAPFMQGHFVSVPPSTGRAEVLDLMRAHTISQIPIVDLSDRLVGLHLMREILGSPLRPNWAVIMAGGRGQRLQPITDTIPKPMIKVAGRPILERIVLHLVGAGIRRIFISVNYKAEMIERHFGDGSSLGCTIDYLREKRPLGTAGALALVDEQPIEPLLVVNGDLLTQFDVVQMLAHHQHNCHMLTVGVRQYLHSIPFGVVEIRDDRAIALSEKPTEVWDVNAGIYVLQPELLAKVPKDVPSSMPTLIDDCLARGESVGAFRLEEDWMDIGRHEDLARARGQEG